MEKIVKKVGNSKVISLTQADREFYDIDIGDRVIFTITEVIKSERNKILKEDGESSIVLD